MILGIAGRKGSGKDTVGDYLIARHGFCRVAFADPVKRVARDLWPHLGEDQLWGAMELKEAVDLTLGVSPRWILQRLGTEVGREGRLDTFVGLGISPGYLAHILLRHGVTPGPLAWIDAVFRTSRAGDVVVTDVRFPNEAQAIRSRPQGCVVRLVRPGVGTGHEETHPSEREVEDCPFDYLVRNDEGRTELYQKIRRLIEDVRRNG